MATLKKSKGFAQEFKEFAARGNVVDLAIGVVIGAAFGKITTSLVDDIFMPVFGKLFGSMDFTQWKIVLQAEITEGEAVLQPEIAIKFGVLIGALINFLLVAFAMFLVVKAVNRMRAKPPEAPPAPPEPTAQELLLAEIRDLLKGGALPEPATEMSHAQPE